MVEVGGNGDGDGGDGGGGSSRGGVADSWQQQHNTFKNRHGATSINM